MVSPGDCLKLAWEECVFFYCWVKWSLDVCYVKLTMLFKTSITLLIFCPVFLWNIESGVFFNNFSQIIYFSLKYCRFSFHVSTKSLFLGMLIIDVSFHYYSSFYHYKMSLFLVPVSTLKYFLFDLNTAILPFLLITTYMVYLFSSCYFNLSVSVNLKSISCRQHKVGF